MFYTDICFNYIVLKTVTW